MTSSGANSPPLWRYPSGAHPETAEFAALAVSSPQYGVSPHCSLACRQTDDKLYIAISNSQRSCFSAPTPGGGNDAGMRCLHTFSAVVPGMISVLRRLGERCSDLSEEYIPDSYVIAIVLTFVAVTAALATGTGPRQTMNAWTGGVWSLLPFMAAISILLMTGDAIAKSPTFTRGVERFLTLDSQPARFRQQQGDKPYVALSNRCRPARGALWCCVPKGCLVLLLVGQKSGRQCFSTGYSRNGRLS